MKFNLLVPTVKLVMTTSSLPSLSKSPFSIACPFVGAEKVISFADEKQADCA
jgi:hypothetical protein